MPTRQKFEEIERKPKAVHKVASWTAPAGISANSESARKVEHIVRCIEAGAPLTTGHYRKGKGRDRDFLLEKHGIMHLHLGRSNTPELLYLVQYPDHVVLLELSGHAHFASRPVGKGLMAAHDAFLAAKEAEIDAAPRRTKIVLGPRSKLPPKLLPGDDASDVDPSGATS